MCLAWEPGARGCECLKSFHLHSPSRQGQNQMTGLVTCTCAVSQVIGARGDGVCGVRSAGCC